VAEATEQDALYLHYIREHQPVSTEKEEFQALWNKGLLKHGATDKELVLNMKGIVALKRAEERAEIELHLAKEKAK
jgi:hypothetical protein